MGLGFGFFLDFPGKKLSLKTQGYFCYCWSVLAQSPSLSCSSPHPISGEAGGSQEAGRGHSRNSWPQLIPDIFLSIWHHVQHIELGEEEEYSEWWCLSSQVTIRGDKARLSSGWHNTCLPTGNDERIPHFAFLVCGFCFTCYIVSVSTHEFFLWILCPILLMEQWASCCVGLNCPTAEVKPQQCVPYFNKISC